MEYLLGRKFFSATRRCLMACCFASVASLGRLIPRRYMYMHIPRNRRTEPVLVLPLRWAASRTNPRTWPQMCLRLSSPFVYTAVPSHPTAACTRTGECVCRRCRRDLQKPPMPQRRCRRRGSVTLRCVPATQYTMIVSCACVLLLSIAVHAAILAEL